LVSDHGGAVGSHGERRARVVKGPDLRSMGAGYVRER
jgi:hypothetical protein